MIGAPLSLLLLVAPGGPDAGAAQAPTAPTPALHTPWPAVLPCARPRWALLPAHPHDDLVWAGRDPHLAITFPRSTDEARVRLAPRFPAGQLERLSSARAGATPARWIHLECALRPGDTAEHASLEWTTSRAGLVEVSASYPISAVPRPRRIERWVEPSSPYDDETTTEGPSRFRAAIAGRGRTAAQLAEPSVRLARDLAADLRDVLRAACGRGRCASLIQATDAALATFIRAKAPTYARLDKDGTEVEPFGHGYKWTATGDGATVRISCGDHTNGLTYQTLCAITVDLGAAGTISYDAFRYEAIELDPPAGGIRFEHAGKETRVTISGAALAMRAAPP
jgi:hypothetical protein